jgi:GT2 family glycosyltransferase
MNKEFENITLAPIRILEIEIGQPLSPISPEDKGYSYQQALCLVRLHSYPLGMIELDLTHGPVNADDCAQHIWNALGAKISAHLQQDNLPAIRKLAAEGLQVSRTPRCIEERERFLKEAPFVSIIVPTHERPERIPACLHALLALDYPHYEIIVVDNAPETDATAKFMRENYHNDPRVRFVCEERAGVSWARNRGIQLAKGEILAFADDDVIVDRYWLAELVKAFQITPNVGCVTGLILSAELETPAQILFEKHDEESGYNDQWRFNQHIFTKQKRHVHLYKIALFGAGASMAFRADLLRNIGGFDPALGTQGLVQSGEDIAAYFKILMQGHDVVYEPASLVYHKNRREYAALYQQIYHYGIGATAYLTKNLLEHPQLMVDLFTKVPYDLLMGTRASKKKQPSLIYPKELAALSRKGMLRGPFVYLKGRWITRGQRKVLALLQVDGNLSVEKGESVS